MREWINRIEPTRFVAFHSLLGKCSLHQKLLSPPIVVSSSAAGLYLEELQDEAGNILGQSTEDPNRARRSARHSREKCEATFIWNAERHWDVHTRGSKMFGSGSIHADVAAKPDLLRRCATSFVFNRSASKYANDQEIEQSCDCPMVRWRSID